MDEEFAMNDIYEIVKADEEYKEELRYRQQIEKERRWKEEEEEKRYKQVTINLEFGSDERYCYHNNKAQLQIYVDKDWSSNKILKYIKKNLCIWLDE